MNNFYNTEEWKKLRFRALVHYPRKCMICFTNNRELVVSHKRSISEFPELKLEISNIEILCDDCKIGKSDNFVTIRNKGDLLIDNPNNKKIDPGKKGYLRITSKTCHIWDGKDTSCKMWSSGGLKKDEATFFEKPTSRICKICQQFENNSKFKKVYFP